MKKFDDIIVKNPIPMVVFSGDGQLVEFVNDSFTEFLGYEQKDVSDQIKWSEKLYPNPDYREQVFSIWLNDLNYKKTSPNQKIERDFEVVSKDGRVFNVVFHLMTTETNVILILKDVTEKKKLSFEREEAETEVTKLNRKLIEKNKELEQVVYVTSHDLRSPLINIIGFSKELQMSVDEIRKICEEHDNIKEALEKLKYIFDEDLPETTNIIRQSAVKMDSLLAALLKLSRSGRGVPVFKELDLNQIIEEIQKENKFIIDQKGIKLEKSELHNCTGDSLQINQIFTNLITNAINYSDSQKPDKYIRISSYKENGDVIYKVEDNGIGIKKENLKNVFEIFRRLNEIEVAGDGLGLTIVKKLVDIHNGEVWIESEYGKGTTFFIKIPTNLRN